MNKLSNSTPQLNWPLSIRNLWILFSPIFFALGKKTSQNCWWHITGDGRQYYGSIYRYQDALQVGWPFKWFIIPFTFTEVSPDIFEIPISLTKFTTTIWGKSVVLGRELIWPFHISNGNGNPPFPIGSTSSNGGFSIAMLVYQRVATFWPRHLGSETSSSKPLSLLHEQSSLLQVLHATSLDIDVDLLSLDHSSDVKTTTEKYTSLKLTNRP